MRGIGSRLIGSALVGATVFIVSGCAWLYGLGGVYPIPESSPGPPVTYVGGRATLTIGPGPAIELGDFVEGGSFAADFGVNATYRNADGWYLRIMGASKGTSSYMPAYLTIERIVDAQHWTTFDGSRCTIAVTKADATGLSGTASCKDLRWTDALRTPVGPSYAPPFVEDEPAFDAEITFEAAPSTTRTS